MPFTVMIYVTNLLFTNPVKAEITYMYLSLFSLHCLPRKNELSLPGGCFSATLNVCVFVCSLLMVTGSVPTSGITPTPATLTRM